MNTMSKRGFRCFVSAILVIAIVTNSQPVSAFSTAIHERVTRNALPFLTDRIQDIIVDGNEDEDEGKEKDMPWRHGQNCQFRASADYVNMRYHEVVDALREPWPNDPDRAPRLFGHLLHGLQDFYAHSNWIPTPPDGLGIRGRLLDSGLGEWPVPEPYSILFGNVVILEGNPPPGVTVRLTSDANGNVSSAIPIVLDERNLAGAPLPLFRGLMTSGALPDPYDEEDLANQFCYPVGSDCTTDSPDDVCLRHGDKRSSDTSAHTFDGAGRLNLDGEGGGDWFVARHVAKLQTRHEWCRLLHLSRDFDPTFVASGRLLGTWVGTDSWPITPHIPGTPCERGAVRHHLVEISATPAANAPGFVPFVVFRSDFTSSARTAVFPQATKTLRICGNTDEKIIASVMPARIKGATLIIQVPETARSWIARDHRGAFSVSFSIKVTPNVC